MDTDQLEALAKEFNHELMMARKRMRLLTKKYEGTASVEDQARIDVLTERLRKLSPRVRNDDLQRAEAMVDSIERLSTYLDEMRKKVDVWNETSGWAGTDKEDL